MQSVNHVAVTGNLTRDIQLKYTSGGMAIAEIGLAVNNRVKKGDQWEDSPVFLDVTAFGKTAEFASEQLSKGSPCLCVGKIVMDSWTDKQSGQKRTKLKINADTVQPLMRFSKPDGQQGGRRQEQESEPAHTSTSYDDPSETPF